MEITETTVISVISILLYIPHAYALHRRFGASSPRNQGYGKILEHSNSFVVCLPASLEAAVFCIYIAQF